MSKSRIDINSARQNLLSGEKYEKSDYWKAAVEVGIMMDILQLYLACSEIIYEEGTPVSNNERFRTYIKLKAKNIANAQDKYEMWCSWSPTKQTLEMLQSEDIEMHLLGRELIKNKYKDFYKKIEL